VHAKAATEKEPDYCGSSRASPAPLVRSRRRKQPLDLRLLQITPVGEARKGVSFETWTGTMLKRSR